MKKYIISGSNGFVGKHLISYLSKDENNFILGLDLSDECISVNNFTYKKINLQDRSSLQLILDDYQPDYFIHLAAFSSVGKSWLDPESCFKNNTDIFINILESIKFTCKKCRILSVGSSEEYGHLNENEIPVKETKSLIPNNPYAVARVAQELLTKVYVDGYGLNIVLTRSFNHIGPGQRQDFAIPSFIRKVIEAKDKISVGNINVIRDFTDVRDVVKAYDQLLKYGESGEAYNICSGKGIALQDVIKIIQKELGKEFLEIYSDPDLIRPTEIPVMIGDNTKITSTTGWSPEISLSKSIHDTINYVKN